MDASAAALDSLSTPTVRSERRRLGSIGRAAGRAFTCAAILYCVAMPWAPAAVAAADPAELPAELSTQSPESFAAEPIAENLREAMIEDLRFLTSDSLQGRSSIDPSILEAADHVADRFRGMGLQTELYDGSPLQFLDIAIGPKIAGVENNFLSIAAEGTPDAWQLGRDFNPLAIGAESGSVTGELVWVGYGIRADEYSYDDYAGVDVQGKIVMMLRKEPGAADPDSPFDGANNTRHAFFDTKVATAIDAGAAAILIVNDPASVEKMVRDVESRQTSERKRLEEIREQLAALPEEAVQTRDKIAQQITRIEEMLAGVDGQTEVARRGLIEIGGAGVGAKRGVEKISQPNENESINRPPVPVLFVSRQFADHVLPRPLTGIESEIDGDFKPRSLELAGTTVSLGVELTPSSASSPNVIGVLPGRGNLSEETLIIGAHYDHVGMGGYGSLAPGTVAIHNGADDNASGTSSMLRVAGRMTQAFSASNAPDNHRRIVFIAFTGEERGLLGSKHYVQQPRFPLSTTVAMINMDMVGRLNDNELTVYGTGSAPTFDVLIEQTNEQAKFDLVKVPGGYGPSDHASFYEAGIPVLFFFTGLHSDYHRPSDDFDKLNLDGMDRITDLISQVSERLATVPERPVYLKTEKGVQIRRQLTVVMGVKMSQQPPEVVLSSILAGGPAEEGGLLEGDRLLKVGKQPIESIDDLMDQLRRRSPGDMLPVIVRRDDEELKFEIKLRPR